jgi:hypothetical protein
MADMVGFFSNRLTAATHHYIDWSRVGNLVRSGSHRYSSQEIMTRGAIVSVTGVSAFLGYVLNDSQKTNCTATSAVLICGFVGFVLSHTFVIAPLIKKRCEMSREFSQLRNEIVEKLRVYEKEPFALFITQVIDHISNLSLSDGKQARASETWGRRLALLTQVSESFELEQDEFILFWYGSKDEIMGKLTSSRGNQYRSAK